MIMSTTTSVRLDDEVKQKLDELSQQIHRPKNWIINQALSEFIDRNSVARMLEKARQQCLLANQQDDSAEASDWDQLAAEAWDEDV